MCLTQPVNMLKTHKSVKENSFEEVQTDLEGPPLTIPISIEFKILEMTLKFFEKLLFFGDFPLFQKDGISDNDMLEEHQRPERGKMLIQVAKLKVPRGHLLLFQKRRSEFTRHIRALGLNYRHSPLNKKGVDY